MSRADAGYEIPVHFYTEVQIMLTSTAAVGLSAKLWEEVLFATLLPPRSKIIIGNVFQWCCLLEVKNFS